MVGFFYIFFLIRRLFSVRFKYRPLTYNPESGILTLCLLIKCFSLYILKAFIHIYKLTFENLELCEFIEEKSKEEGGKSFAQSDSAKQ